MMSLRALLVSSLVSSLVAAPLAAQAPPLPPASPPPPASIETPKLLPPPANAVAQCGDLTFVVAPAEPSACATRGGVKVTLPGPRKAPTPEAAAPALRTPATPATSSARDDAPPAGATMRCRDGSWLTGTPAASRCERNGGLAVVLPAPPPAPPRSP